MSWLTDAFAPKGYKSAVAGRDAFASDQEQKQQEGSNLYWGNQETTRLSPILAALQSQYAAKVDPTRRNEYAGWASRGWGQSGGASNAITQALANLETEKQGAIASARKGVQSDIASERAAEDQRKATEESNRLQKEANKAWWE